MLGYGSDAINGQLVGVRTRDGYNPITYGPVVNVNPSTVTAVPPSLGPLGGTAGGSSYTGGDATDTAGASNTANAAYSAAHPWDFKRSPVLMAILFLAIGLIGLHFVHWR